MDQNKNAKNPGVTKKNVVPDDHHATAPEKNSHQEVQMITQCFLGPFGIQQDIPSHQQV